MPDISLDTARGPMPVHVAEPPGDGPHPGVVVIADALGMTTDLRNQAKWLASEGYLAAAPDLFHWGGRARCLFATIGDALRREGHVFDVLEATRRWLGDHPRSTGRVGVIGFCLGGGLAVLLAGNGRYDAASVNYGAVPKDALDLLAGACPIVGSYGARDSLRMDMERLVAALGAHDIPHDVHEYPEAGHSFLNDHDPAEVPRWAVVAGAFSDSEYHEASALDARRRISAFFGEHLRG
jgi:carboxymethylenebutenolidase